MAGPEHQNVAFSETDPLRPLDRLELRARHRLAGFEPVEAAIVGGVKQHAAPDDASGIGCDASPFRAARGQERRGLAVIELTLVGDVVKRVDVRMGVSMTL